MASTSTTSTTSTISLLGPNTIHFIKLDASNYLLWPSHIKSFLIGHDLWKYVDGSYPQPFEFITTTDTTTSTPPTTTSITNLNPDFLSWYQQDQLVVSYITTTLSPTVLSLTIGHDSAKSIWECLQNHYTQRNLASASSLRFQLHDMSKGSKTIDDYLNHAKSLDDALFSINKHVSDEDLVNAVLRGLGAEFSMFVTTILNQLTLPSFTDLRSHLLAFENQSSCSLDSTGHTTALITTHSSSASYAQHISNQQQHGSSNQQQGGSRGGHHGGYRSFYRDGRRSGYKRWQHHAPPSTTPPWQQPWTSPFSPRGSAPRAQWHQLGILGALPQAWYSKCSTNQHITAQCPHKFSGPDSFPSYASAHTLQPHDPNWYPRYRSHSPHDRQSSIPSTATTLYWAPVRMAYVPCHCLLFLILLSLELSPPSPPPHGTTILVASSAGTVELDIFPQHALPALLAAPSPLAPLTSPSNSGPYPLALGLSLLFGPCRSPGPSSSPGPIHPTGPPLYLALTSHTGTSATAGPTSTPNTSHTPCPNSAPGPCLSSTQPLPQLSAQHAPSTSAQPTDISSSFQLSSPVPDPCLPPPAMAAPTHLMTTQHRAGIIQPKTRTDGTIRDTLQAVLSATRHVWSPRVFTNNQALTTQKPLVRLSSPLASSRFSALPSLEDGLFINLTLKMHFSMVFSMKMSTWSNHQGLWILPSLPTFASSTKHYMVSNKLLVLGFIALALSSYLLGSPKAGSHLEVLQEFISTLGSEFDIKDLGPLSYFLGLQVTHSNGSLHLSQVKYAHDLFQHHHMLDCKSTSTPLAAKSFLLATEDELLSSPTSYRKVVGCLQYLTITRPDLAFTVNSVAQYMSAPRSSHMIVVKRILLYIKETLDFGLTLRPQSQPSSICAYSNADWVGCPNSRRSTTGYLIYLGTNSISWCSKKQPTVSRPSMELEYRSLAHACAETTWLSYLLVELGVQLTFLVFLHYDNLSATYLAANPVFHARTRHIKLDYHFVREKVALGSHRVCFIPSIDQLADLLTKALHKPRHQLLRSNLVLPSPSGLRGGISESIQSGQLSINRSSQPPSSLP
ncbi:unnamed protein product [Prunus armeniaca]